MRLIDKNTKKYTRQLKNHKLTGYPVSCLVIDCEIPTIETNDMTVEIPYIYIKSVVEGGKSSIDERYSLCTEIVEMSEAEKVAVDAEIKSKLDTAEWVRIKKEVKNLLLKADAVDTADFADPHLISNSDLGIVRTWRKSLRKINMVYTDPFNKELQDLLLPENVSIQDENVKNIFIELF